MNFIDAHPRVQTVFPHDVSVMTDLVLYWRKSLLDGVYNVPGSLIRPADNSLARFVGYRPGAELRWQINRHAYLQADYGIFYAGRFLKQTMPGQNLNYLAFWVQILGSGNMDSDHTVGEEGSTLSLQLRRRVLAVKGPLRRAEQVGGPSHVGGYRGT